MQQTSEASNCCFSFFSIFYLISKLATKRMESQSFSKKKSDEIEAEKHTLSVVVVEHLKSYFVENIPVEQIKQLPFECDWNFALFWAFNLLFKFRYDVLWIISLWCFCSCFHLFSCSKLLQPNQQAVYFIGRWIWWMHFRSNFSDWNLFGWYKWYFPHSFCSLRLKFN